MPLVEVPVSIGFGDGFSQPFEAQICDNFIPQAAQTLGTSSPGALYHSPGIDQFAVAGTGPHRGAISVADVPYWVSGESLFTANKFGEVENLGIIAGTKRVSMAGNGLTVAIIVPGEVGYFHTVGGSTVEISSPVFLEHMDTLGGVFSVVYVSGFFVYTSLREFFNGSLNIDNKGQDFLALDVGSADSSPDNIVGAFATRDELYIFSDESVQVFQATGATTAPFVNIPGALIPKGLASQYAVSEFSNSFIFLGGGVGDPVSIWLGGSGTATKISTAPIDDVLSTYTKDELATAYTSVYGETGSVFCVVSLPRDTFVYDAVTSVIQGRPMWHTRSTAGGAWDVSSIIRIFGKNLVGSSVTGNVGEMSLANHREFDVIPIREFAGAYFQDKTNALFMSNVELVAESGVGNPISDPSGTDPQIELLVSKNGGRSYVSRETRGIGMEGETEKRMRWNRLGRTPTSAIFKFRVEADVKLAFTKVVTDLSAARAS